IALAKKETLVCAGELVMKRASASGAQILPVDSEHSAFFQCLEGNRDKGAVKRMLLTASGGPFFGMTRAQLETVTKQQALRHPNWSMGPKITIDSATLMNKGLEFIEAMHLFGVTPGEITILIHRESVIHSMIEYQDGSVIAQMAEPDMRLPIQYALTYPRRLPSLTKGPDFFSLKPLTFAKPDLETFRCLKLALQAAETGGTACTVLNAANEVAVSSFLEGKCRFLDIERIVGETVSLIAPSEISGLSSVLEADRAAREAAVSCLKREN
ncbi:MAG: 1-deoxy-D-xylulose-5-phosphate reductoisomerase, partial [Oscillospiraceae bacterium]|nr:1-deoxy-D-xylulose-5-phosphate reductoisomerase [Oscillospiraceae bacterium]